MARMTWFKLYDEMMDDPKMLSLDDGTVLLWVRMMCLANKNEAERGVIPRAPRVGLAKQLFTTVEQLNAALEIFASEDYRMVSIRDDGAIVLCNWEKRNARRPSEEPAQVAARQQRSRRQRSGAIVTHMSRRCHDDVTRDDEECHDDVTRDKGDMMRDSIDVTTMSRACHTSLDKRVESRESTPLTPLGGTSVLPDNHAEEFVQFWQAYPVKQRKAAAFAAWENALAYKRASPADLVAAAKNYAQSVKGRYASKCKLPDNFLHQDIWCDYVDGPVTSNEIIGDEEDEPTGRYIPNAEETRRRMAEEESFLRGDAHA